jgi:hypothetical protein
VTRTLDWSGCLNVRDLGGVPLEGGGETRFGSLIRADNVGGLTGEGWQSLAGHGVARIVDLRWREEIARDPPRDLDVEVVHAPLLGEFDPDYRDDRDSYVAADDPTGYWTWFYARVLEQNRAEIVRALAAIADADGPVVFHCLGGKDRTGLVAALLLRLAGAPVGAVAADYALTERQLERAEEYEPKVLARFMRRTPPAVMVQTLERLEREHGSVEAYLRSAGLDAERLRRLRERLRPV